MPKSKEPRAPVRAPVPTPVAPELSPAERAKAIIERQLAQKKHGGPPGAGNTSGVHKPSKGGWSPAPIRPGGRGRRG